ncbi:2,3,4,5-tetrahydropyridine-2,6-dicarboxylate N-succinyltransferase [Myxococcota bacterium]|nr:2,3,4,5-tetrahydropyridine-2,6-dicarboxylate N-succinyltransferase [Myxococcota bacterium]
MTEDATLRARIEAAYADRALLERPLYVEAVREAVAAVGRGELRVAEKGEAGWTTHAWLSQAILLYFAVSEMRVMEAGPLEWYDKIPVQEDWAAKGVRVVPPAVVRHGAHVERGAVLMPCYVNIGARIEAGTMVDTWATVGSCAQIGRGVHLSGGVGIGGVLEPPGATPVIVEDGAFVGSRCVVVEGVIVEEEAVLGANVVLTASTPIIDVTGPEPVEHRGRVPARSVVVPGTRPRRFPAGEFALACALIVGRRKESTDRRTSLNEALRDFGVTA